MQENPTGKDSHPREYGPDRFVIPGDEGAYRTWNPRPEVCYCVARSGFQARPGEARSRRCDQVMGNPTMISDPIEFELFKNSLFSIADEMALTIFRTTYWVC